MAFLFCSLSTKKGLSFFVYRFATAGTAKITASFTYAGKTYSKACKITVAKTKTIPFAKASTNPIVYVDSGFHPRSDNYCWVTVKWTAIEGADGYQVRATSLSGRVYDSCTASKLSATLYNIPSRQVKYYVQVRAFKTVNGKNVYSAWSDNVRYFMSLTPYSDVVYF